jgi:hypothetical protein
MMFSHPEQEDHLLPDLSRQLEQGWGIAPHRARGPSDWHVILAALEERISHLLKHDPRKLTTAMYLLDISEKNFAAAMEQPTMEDRAHALACVVMERETQKIRTRHAYSKKHIEGGRE